MRIRDTLEAIARCLCEGRETAFSIRGWRVSVSSSVTGGYDPSQLLTVELSKGPRWVKIQDLAGAVKVSESGPYGPWNFNLTKRGDEAKLDQLLNSMGAPTYTRIMDTYEAKMGDGDEEPNIYGGP